jgi:hypothetical protein
VVIDTSLYKELTYQKPAKTFHQFSDSKFAYGLNFASQLEANSFASTLLTAVDKLNGSPPKAVPRPVPPLLLYLLRSCVWCCCVLFRTRQCAHQRLRAWYVHHRFARA